MTALLEAPADLATRLAVAFEQIHRSVFAHDPDDRDGVHVEVIDLGIAYDTPILMLITRWTLNAIAFPPDDRFPRTIRMRDRDYVADLITLPNVEAYRSVNLAPGAVRLPSPAHARKVARLFAPDFRAAVEEIRRGS